MAKNDKVPENGVYMKQLMSLNRQRTNMYESRKFNLGDYLVIVSEEERLLPLCFPDCADFKDKPLSKKAVQGADPDGELDDAVDGLNPEA
jgi:hypothetical protein